MPTITADFAVANHGTVWTFRPLTPDARSWWAGNVQAGATLGSSYAVEHRYAEAILDGIAQDGLCAQPDLPPSRGPAVIDLIPQRAAEITIGF